MSLRKLLPACLVASALAVAAASPGAPADEALHDVMEGLKRQLKTLSTATPDEARRAEALAAVAEMQALVLSGKLMQPSNLAEVPEEQRAAHALAYRKDMARLLERLAGIEIALCEGRTDDVTAAIEGPLLELREASHDAYQESGGGDDRPDGDGGSGRPH